MLGGGNLPPFRIYVANLERNGTDTVEENLAAVWDEWAKLLAKAVEAVKASSRHDRLADLQQQLVVARSTALSLNKYALHRLVFLL
tara:strand:+ start:437 stop:694 length:258 start_codon:yes stop_codon:yes gene_type:complete|eukprot:scaffold145073_cov130-Phaeocystis_antarctica.AAC.2